MVNFLSALHSKSEDFIEGTEIRVEGEEAENLFDALHKGTSLQEVGLDVMTF